MAYDAGSIEATLLARFEEVGFKKFDQAYERARIEAQKKVQAHLGAEVDDRAFAVYTAKLRDAQQKAARRDAYKAQLGADFDARAFNAMERELAKTRANTKTTERDVNVFSRALHKLGAAGGGAGDGMLKLRTDIGPLSGPLRAMTGVLAVLLPSMVAVAGAAVALGSSLAAAAAGAAAVSVGLAAAVGPLGAIMGAITQRLGMISDAYKALSNEQVKGGVQAAANAETQRAAAERVKSAQLSLADSNRSVMRAQEDLTVARFKARREVQDLTDAITHSAFAEERASLTLREVLQRLAETEADPEATRLQLDQARFAVKEAKHAVKDTAREHARANTDARRGIDTVRDATEQLADARRNAAKASDQVAAANAAAATAIAKQGAAATDAQQKLAQLTDVERRLLRTFQNFAKAARETFQPATEAIFTGISSALERLQPAMERFRGRFGALGRSIGGIIDHAAESLAGPQWTRALDSFIATAQRIVRPLSNAFGSVVNIFRNIAVAAQPYVIEFADYMERALGRLERKSGGSGMNSLIKELVDSTRAWWGLLVAVGDLLITIFNGGKKEGDSLVESMTRMVERWDAFLETDEGQRKMKEFFRDAVKMTKDLVKALMAIADGFITLSRWAMRVNWAWDTVERAMLRGSHEIAYALREMVVGGFDLLLGAFTQLMGGISSIASALGALPGGGRFKDIATAIDSARDSMDDFRKSTRDASDEMGRRQNIKLLQGDVTSLRTRLGHLDKGSKEYRETSVDLRGKQRQLNRAMADAKEAGDKGAKGPRALGLSGAAAARAVDRANQKIADGYNSLAKQLGGIKEIKYSASGVTVKGNDGEIKADTGDILKAKGGRIRRRAVGGWIGERGMVGEDTVPIIAAPGEAVLNRHQVPMVDDALAAAGYGGLDDLFARVQRPHYMATGGIVPVPGFPGERANKSILGKIAGIVKRFPGLVLTDAFGPGHASPSHTVYGTAADFAGPDRVMDRAVRYLTSKGYLTGYDGRYGSADWPGHGPAAGQGGANAHLHVELGGKGGAIRGGGGLGALIEEIGRVKINGPGGGLKRIAQRAVDKVRGAANRKLGAANAAMGALGSPHMGAEGKAGSNKQVRSWLYQGLKLAGVPPTPANINTLYGRVMQESGGNPRAINLWDSNAKAGIPSKGLLQTIDPTFNAHKVRGHNDIWNPVHNVAAAVRYMLSRYKRLVGRSSTGHARGGRVGNTRSPARRGSGGGGGTQLSLRALSGKQTDRITSYDAILASVDQDQKLYTQADRRYNLSDEELIDPETGFVNVAAVRQKAAELLALQEIRQRIEDKLRKARDIALRVVRAYKTIIKRLKNSLKHVKGKKRDGPKAQIAAYQERLTEWEGKATDAQADVEDARLDVQEIGKERAAVLGTQADVREAPERPVLTEAQQAQSDALERDEALAKLTPDKGDDEAARAAQESFWRGVLGNLQSTGAPDSLITQAANTLAGFMAEIAETATTSIATQVAEAVRALDANRSDLFRSFGSNFISPGANAFAAAGGVRNFGATGGAAGYEQTGSVLGASGGTQVSVSNHFAAPPPDPHIWSRNVAYELKAAV